MSQLIVQDFGGAHNADLGKTRARLIRGGSWRRQRTIVILPADYDRVEHTPDGKQVVVKGIPAKVCLSLWNLAFPPNQPVVRILALGDEVGISYSQAIEGVLQHPELKNFEYVLTVEHDNTCPPDGAIKLIEDLEQHPELDAVGGLYFCKFEGGCAQIWGDPKAPEGLNFRPQLPDPNGGLVECCGTGMGFTMFRLQLFKDERIKKPWFRTLNGKDGTGIGTQDLSFWGEARKFGHRCAVDCSVRIGHLDPATGTVW
jgi:hypothetical protein